MRTARTDAIYKQFNGIAGAAYFIAGLGMTALTSPDEKLVVVPIRSGLGLRTWIQRRLSQIYDGTDLEPILNGPLSLPLFNKYLALVSVPKSAKVQSNRRSCRQRCPGDKPKRQCTG